MQRFNSLLFKQYYSEEEFYRVLSVKCGLFTELRYGANKKRGRARNGNILGVHDLMNDSEMCLKLY